VLPTREEELTYYAVSVGFNFFPGEVFLGKNRAMTSAVYVLAGAGNTSFVNEDRFSINFGIGVRMLPADWLALHVTVRDYIFESDILGTNKQTHNFELTLGMSVYF
jgi:outer membrane beta-barrel protein